MHRAKDRFRASMTVLALVWTIVLGGVQVGRAQDATPAVTATPIPATPVGD